MIGIELHSSLILHNHRDILDKVSGNKNHVEIDGKDLLLQNFGSLPDLSTYNTFMESPKSNILFNTDMQGRGYKLGIS